MRGRAALVLAALAGSGAVVFADAFAQTPASRTVDQTYRCATVLRAGARKVTVQAHSAVAGQKDLFGDPARSLVQVETAGGLGETVLASLSAGPRTQLRPYSVRVGGDRCKATSVAVPLSSRGLDGGAASPFGDGAECGAPRTVLVRVRGVFAAPTRLRRIGDGRLITNAVLSDGQLTVTTVARKPLLYATVSASGKARLFTAQGCIPE